MSETRVKCNGPDGPTRLIYFFSVVFLIGFHADRTRDKVIERIDALERRMNIAPLSTEVEKR